MRWCCPGLLAVVLLNLFQPCGALDNGLARTPPMGYNSKDLDTLPAHNPP